jgi:cytochrome P450
MTPRLLPPGPPSGRLSGTVAFHRDPLAVLRDTQRTFGDVFTMRLASTGPFVVVAETKLAEGIANADPGCAAAGAARRRMLPMASPLSVFGGDGGEHDAARKRIAAAFTPDALAAHTQAIGAIAERHVQSWPQNRPFRLLPRMRAITDQIFVREVLGVADPRAGELAAAIAGLLWAPGNPPLTIPGPEQGLVGRLVDRVYRRRRARIAVLLGAEIQARRREESPGAGVLGLLLADEPRRTADRIVEELLALLMAAQEPMAAALTWLTLCASGSRERADRLREEGMQSVYADAVVTETFRLHPAAVASLRELTAPMTIAGHELPAGTTVMAPIPLLHRDPRCFAEPDRFVPERHLAGTPAQDLMAFGRGARSCLGEQLAHAEIQAILPAIWGHGKLRPLGSQPERMVLRGTILVPRRSGLVLRGCGGSG